MYPLWLHFVMHCTVCCYSDVMLNGYSLVDTHKIHSPDESSANSEVSPVATLCNLGNTCFLNSVLYTLRFAPAFLHNLHHLAVDLFEYSGRYSHLKVGFRIIVMVVFLCSVNFY